MANNPFTYAEQFNPNRTQPLPSQTAPLDPVVAEIRRQREQERRLDITLSGKPDDVAQVSKLSRQAGLPPALVEDRVEDVQKRLAADAMENLLRFHPQFAKIMGEQPRTMVAAQDDTKALGLLGGAWDTLKKAPDALISGFYGLSAQGAKINETLAVGAGDFLDTLGVMINPGSMTRGELEQRKKDRLAYWRGGVSNAVLAREAARPKTIGSTQAGVLAGIESLPMSLGAMLTTVATRNPTVGASMMGVATGGEAYYDSRQAGRNVLDSVRYGATYGGIEALTEKIPVGILADAMTKKTPFGKAFLASLAADMPGEQLATFGQDLIEYAALNPDKPFSDYVQSRPDAMYQTALASLTGSAVQTSVATGVQRATDAGFKLADKVNASRAAKQERAFFDQAGRAAEESKLRARDPEAYAELLRRRAEIDGVRHVFVPGEAVLEYMQSDSYDSFSDPFYSYESEAQEAAASGGDVVLPVEFAVGTLPGTPAWQALKDDMRLSAGGMSPREAETFDEAMADVMAEMTDQMAEQDRQDMAARSVRERLVDEVAAKLGSSYTAPAARTMAEVTVTYLERRAQRLGEPLTGNEMAGVDIAQVLPEAAVPFAKRVEDMGKIRFEFSPRLIGAIKGVSGKSETLIDFIRRRGGVEDPGGDLRSMGAAGIKGVSKKGQAKIVRPAAQPSMLGSGPNLNTLESMFDAAVSEGFFPDLYVQREEGSNYSDALDLNVFLDAIGAGLRGEHIFAKSAEKVAEDEAANVLRQMLVEAGYDPSKMSNADIADSLATLTVMAQDGGYEQLADTIDIDGVQRPTRNSEGMPLAGSEQGIRAFWAWFGDSKVVDDQGRPLVVYHGTGVEVDAFNTDGGRGKTFGTGAFFSSNPATASTYAVGQQASVAPVYLALQNPAVFDAKGSNWNGIDKRAGVSVPAEIVPDDNEALMAELEDRAPVEGKTKKLKPKNTTLARLWPDEFQYGDETASTDDLARWARKTGYESAIIENVKDHGPSGAHSTDAAREPSTLYVAFDPTQIKSINNRGTFDPADPRILYQGFNDGPRGRIQFDQGRVLIELFQARNLSTYFHEWGHLTLENLRSDASLPNASDELKADWQAVSDWFKSNGHEVTDAIPTEAHELWARGFERYLMEGKAPTQGLKRLFETIRGWMLSIYKTLDALRSPITPEIREVMDRLLATDEEIQAAREEQGLAELFKDAATIGISGQEFDAYKAQVEAAKGEATGELLDKTMKALRSRETAKYREMRKGVRAEVEQEVDALPLYRALRLLKDTPMSREWIEREFGAGMPALLPRRRPPIYSEEGGDPTALAEMAGFATAREMVQTLAAAEQEHREAKEKGDKRTMRDRRIEIGTDDEMNRRVGDPLNDGSIEREAVAAVHNEMQGELLATEIRILSRKTGQRPTPYRIAREWARGKVRQGSYSDEASPSAIQRHARNAAKAGREAEKAMLASKFDEAFRFKQQQMLSSALLSEAKLAHDDVIAAQRRLEKVAKRATMKSVDQDYLDQAHALLEAVDLRPRSQKAIDRQGKWEAWAAAREAEGFDIVVPASFEAALGQTNWSRLPVEQLLGLDAAVKQIIHLGRLKQELIDNKDRREFDAVVKEAVDGAGNLKQKPPRGLLAPTWGEQFKSGIANIDASLIKMETVFDWLDGGDPNGVFNRVVFRPIYEAQGREQDMLADYLAQIKALFDAVPDVKRWQDKVTLPFTNRNTGLPEVVRRHQLIAIALNTGNAGNMQRLTDGYGWNAGALSEYLATELTETEWQFVQDVWDVVETLWPQIEAMEKRVNGVAPDKVEPTQIVTPFGTLRGGYYPAIYDDTFDYRAEENKGRETDLFESSYTRASTRSSATKARSEKVSRPILLDLGVINRHLSEVIHDITHREAVMQANRVLSDERIMRAVDSALGPEIRKQFRPWVKFVANSWAMERAGNEGFGKWLGKLRANATAVGLGLRATTMMTQISGYANSTEVIGERWMAEGIARASANPIEAFRFVMENSPEVRHRMDTLDRDVRTELARLSATNPATKLGHAALEGRRFFFHGIGYMDRVVTIPTWLGAYHKALAGGATEEDAVYAADKVVRISQGSASPKDMAAIQRGTGKWGEALKLLTMFYTYLSALYQRERTLARDVMGRDARKPRNMPKLASRAFWLIVVPPILTEVLKVAAGGGSPPEDDEWWAQWVMRKMLTNAIGPIPLAREVFEPGWNAARGGKTFDPSISPINRALESLVLLMGDVGKTARGEETKKMTKNALETAGYATGLVPGQVASASQFLVDVSAGEADPQTMGDWLEGLSTGKLEDE